MTGDYIHREVQKAKARYKTDDPYELLDALGVRLRESRAYGPGGLKGYCYFSKRTIFVVLNAFLSEAEQRIVAMHEAAHVILHQDMIRVAPMKDNLIFDMTSRTEYQANLFAADFLISDEEVEKLTAQEDMDYFRICKELYISPDLMSFKLFSMIQRGYCYTHYILESVRGLRGQSIVLLEQITTIDKRRADRYIGKLSRDQMDGIDEAIRVSLDIDIPEEVEAP